MTSFRSLVEDECEAEGCFREGEANCGVCFGWFCHSHLRVIILTDQPSMTVCEECKRDYDQAHHQPAVQGD